jgi:hypothetical protein
LRLRRRLWPRFHARRRGLGGNGRRNINNVRWGFGVWLDILKGDDLHGDWLWLFFFFQVRHNEICLHGKEKRDVNSENAGEDRRAALREIVEEIYPRIVIQIGRKSVIYICAESHM